MVGRARRIVLSHTECLRNIPPYMNQDKTSDTFCSCSVETQSLFRKIFAQSITIILVIKAIRTMQILLSLALLHKAKRTATECNKFTIIRKLNYLIESSIKLWLIFHQNFSTRFFSSLSLHSKSKKQSSFMFRKNGYF